MNKTTVARIIRAIKIAAIVCVGVFILIRVVIGVRECMNIRRVLKAKGSEV